MARREGFSSGGGSCNRTCHLQILDEGVETTLRLRAQTAESWLFLAAFTPHDPAMAATRSAAPAMRFRFIDIFNFWSREEEVVPWSREEKVERREFLEVRVIGDGKRAIPLPTFYSVLPTCLYFYTLYFLLCTPYLFILPCSIRDAGSLRYSGARGSPCAPRPDAL